MEGRVRFGVWFSSIDTVAKPAACRQRFYPITLSSSGTFDQTRMPDVHAGPVLHRPVHMGGSRIEGVIAMTPSSSSADGDLAWHSLARFFQCQCQNTIFQLRTDLLLVDLARQRKCSREVADIVFGV